jgi:hypothetical protein
VHEIASKVPACCAWTCVGALVLAMAILILDDKAKFLFREVYTLAFQSRLKGGMAYYKKNTNKEMDVRAENWKGCIPVEIRVASSDMASITMPPPFYALVPRVGYLSM